jgi:hypothetical protein
MGVVGSKCRSKKEYVHMHSIKGRCYLMGCGMVKFGKMHHIHPVFKAKIKQIEQLQCQK